MKKVLNHMDQKGKVKKVRTYNCKFCKEGFTKAQALGGHMNIHSKRRAMAETAASRDHSYSLSQEAKNYSDYNYMADNCMYSTPISSGNCLGPWQEINHSILDTSFARRDSRFSTFSPHGNFGDEDLSLQVGPRVVVYADDQERNEVVDLELRLGPNP